MNSKQAKRAIKLIETLESARGKQLTNIIKYERYGATSTGKRCYATYERQCDIFDNAVMELTQIILGGLNEMQSAKE